MGGGGVDGGDEWEARGGLYLRNGLFEIAMSPRSANHRPKQDWKALRDVSPTQGLNIRSIYIPPIPPSMGPIVSVVTLHGWQKHSRKAVQSA